MGGMTDRKEALILDADLDKSGNYLGLFTTNPTDDVVTVTNISGSGTTVTVTTATAHGYGVGDTFVLLGDESATDYNGGWTTVTGTTGLTVKFTSSKTGWTSGGIPQIYKAVEVSGGSYVRKSIGSTDWNAAVPGAPTSKTGPKSGVTWDFVTPTADWGLVIGFGIFDGSGPDAHLDYFGTVASPTTINNGDPIDFNSTSVVTVQLGDPTDSF